MANFRTSRRNLLKGAGAGIVALGTPHIFTRGAWANQFCNDPGAGKIVFGFNVPQTGTYAEEGLEQLKGYELAIKHINGEGDGGLLKTMKPLALKGNGVLGRKVEYVTGDTQTNTDAARDGARRMIERDGAIMVSGCVTTGEAVAPQSLCQ
jgi:ABC-type branched-subunit amino acid transport system substrate-binding protein